MKLDYAQADRRTVLRAIKSKKLTIEGAARKYGVPTSGVIGWMKLAGMKIPEEYNRPRRERSETPLSAASMGRRSETDR